MSLINEEEEALRFAQTYGCSPKRIARNLGITDEQMKKAISAYYNRYPSVFRFPIEGDNYVPIWRKES